MAEVVSPLSRLPIEIYGKKYSLCFDLDALIEAEEHFTRQGYEVDLYTVLSSAPDLAGLLAILACALHKFHPELGFGEVQKLGPPEVILVVGRSIAAAMAVQETREAFCFRAVAMRLPTGIADA
jgi:hypothetical protein